MPGEGHHDLEDQEPADQRERDRDQEGDGDAVAVAVLAGSAGMAWQLIMAERSSGSPLAAAAFLVLVRSRR
jgi:hypothetical protein